MHTFDMRQFAKHTCSEFLLHHRINLWQELHTLASAPSEKLNIGGKSATIFWDADAVDLDCETGDVIFADGRRVASDLIIGESQFPLSLHSRQS